MHKPFEAEVAQLSPSALPAVPVNPLIAKGEQIYQAQSCNACHGDGGVGTAAAPKLTGTHDRMSADQLTSLLKSPSPKMMAGGMTPLDLPPETLKALMAYVESL